MGGSGRGGSSETKLRDVIGLVHLADDGRPAGVDGHQRAPELGGHDGVGLPGLTASVEDDRGLGGALDEDGAAGDRGREEVLDVAVRIQRSHGGDGELDDAAAGSPGKKVGLDLAVTRVEAAVDGNAALGGWRKGVVGAAAARALGEVEPRDAAACGHVGENVVLVAGRGGHLDSPVANVILNVVGGGDRVLSHEGDGVGHERLVLTTRHRVSWTLKVLRFPVGSVSKSVKSVSEDG